jgi:hypothetical protein
MYDPDKISRLSEEMGITSFAGNIIRDGKAVIPA